ncbi:flagellar hook-basal body complex protein FliE [Defluviimonas sp. WL0002]|uniref:Flagellar hook-basal body complex protein FliE n=1 Tax=Albidovulum marisflavi TaxID=2984159 RepID=A0ABT2Z7E6_9RHOB|nr:flagellar hook-basal body complex protein FliE [Defluviimonas sp. WL0002]MCV2867054.1 flagellar hook-basal body complex protein FliE [Defluviimonas sp. WL0002]
MINQSLAALRGYSQSHVATRPEASSAAGSPSPMARSIGSFAEALSSNESVAMQAMTGGADPHALVEALAQTELAVETAVTLRNKVVEAYQEILRMPV